MASSNFIDYVKISCRSEPAGQVHATSEEKNLWIKGGPDGGDGGRGGHVILKANSQHWTLLHLKYKRHIRAENGEAGSGARCNGKQGDDVIIEVPLGTIAKTGNREILAEVTEDGQEVILLKGGRGGLGNHHFKTATNQTPEHHQPGEPSLEEWIILELKLLADVGLVGFPNAGKSTLLSTVSAARPEIADYPFTTLVPNLGVVAYRNFKSFVMADIPGIIEGASQGKGLGLRFLRHIERNSILLFLVPATSENIGDEYRTLLRELELYDSSLLEKDRLLAISKGDLVDEETKKEIMKTVPTDIPYVYMSSVTQEGISELKDLIWKTLNP